MKENEKQKLLISIIIPAYNVSNKIDKLIDSLTLQEYQNIEIIIVDNNSKDETLNILKNYAKKYKNIYVLTEEKQGPNYARLKGFLHSKGDYILFVDSDDFIMKDTISSFVNCILKTKAEIVIGDYLELSNDYKILKKMYGAPNKNGNLKNDKEILLYKPTLCNKLIKKELIKEDSFIFTSIAEDINISLIALAKANDIRYIKKPVYNYVINDNGLSHTVNFNRLNEVENSLIFLKNNFVKNELYDKYKDELNFIIITHSLYRIFESELLNKKEERNIIRNNLIEFIDKIDYKNNKYYKKSKIYKLVNLFARNNFLYNLFLSRIFINLLFKNKLFNKILKKLDK